MGRMKWWGWGDEEVAFTHKGKPELGPFLERAIDIRVDAAADRPVGFDELHVPEPVLSVELRAALEAAVGAAHVSTDALDRVVHARGKSLRDLVRHRAGELGRVADVVVRPGSEAEVEALVRAARGAQAAQDHLDVVGLGPGRARGVLRRGGVHSRVDVDDRAAAAAREVRVRLGARVEEGRGPAGIDPPDEAERLEQLEGRVDGRQRQPGEALGRRARDLLGVGVAAEFGQDAVEHEPLARDPVPAGAKRRGEPLVGGGAHGR